MLGFNQVPTVQGATNIVCALAGIANSAGSGAGASVTIAVTQTLSDQYNNGRLSNLPNSYIALVLASQPCFANVAGKTSTGFNVILTPPTATATLAAGTFDVLVIS